MNFVDAIDQMTSRLDVIAGLRVSADLPTTVTPPAAWFDYPVDGEYVATYRHGMDTMVIPLFVAVGRVVDRAARSQLGAYCDSGSPTSIVRVLHEGTYNAFNTIKVGFPEFGVITVGTNDYRGAIFDVELSGQGK